MIFLLTNNIIFIKKANDSVALCKLDKSASRSTVETYYNNYHSPPDILNSTYRTFGLSFESITYNNGWLLCSFLRQVRNNSLGDHFFDLNNMYYLLVAKSVLTDKCNYFIVNLFVAIFIFYFYIINFFKLNHTTTTITRLIVHRKLISVKWM